MSHPACAEMATRQLQGLGVCASAAKTLGFLRLPSLSAYWKVAQPHQRCLARFRKSPLSTVIWARLIAALHCPRSYSKLYPWCRAYHFDDCQYRNEAVRLLTCY